MPANPEKLPRHTRATRREDPREVLNDLQTFVTGGHTFRRTHADDAEKLAWMQEVYALLAVDEKLAQKDALAQVNAAREASGKPTFQRKVLANMKKKVRQALTPERRKRSVKDRKQLEAELTLFHAHKHKLSTAHYTFAVVMAEALLADAQLNREDAAELANKAARTTYTRRTYLDIVAACQAGKGMTTVAQARAETTTTQSRLSSYERQLRSLAADVRGAIQKYHSLLADYNTLAKKHAAFLSNFLRERKKLQSELEFAETITQTFPQLTDESLELTVPTPHISISEDDSVGVRLESMSDQFVAQRTELQRMQATVRQLTQQLRKQHQSLGDTNLQLDRAFTRVKAQLEKEQQAIAESTDPPSPEPKKPEKIPMSDLVFKTNLKAEWFVTLWRAATGQSKYTLTEEQLMTTFSRWPMEGVRHGDVIIEVDMELNDGLGGFVVNNI